VKEWFNDDSKKPEVVKEAERKIEDLELRKITKGALYKAIINIIALKGAKDFFTGQSIELITLNDHHIFPKKCGLKLTNENCILNKTLISEATNKSIYKNKPSEYLRKMKNRLGSWDKVKDVLKTHLIDEEAFTALRADDYKEFIRLREELIKEDNEKKNKNMTLKI